MFTSISLVWFFFSSYYLKSKKEKAPKKDDKKGKKGKNVAAPPLDVPGQVKDLKEKVKFISEDGKGRFSGWFYTIFFTGTFENLMK